MAAKYPLSYPYLYFAVFNEGKRIAKVDSLRDAAQLACGRASMIKRGRHVVFEAITDLAGLTDGSADTIYDIASRNWDEILRTPGQTV